MNLVPPLQKPIPNPPNRQSASDSWESPKSLTTGPRAVMVTLGFATTVDDVGHRIRLHDPPWSDPGGSLVLDGTWCSGRWWIHRWQDPWLDQSRHLGRPHQRNDQSAYRREPDFVRGEDAIPDVTSAVILDHRPLPRCRSSCVDHRRGYAGVSKRIRPKQLPDGYGLVFDSSPPSTVFLLLITGGLVTGLEAGLAVPDWPNSFGHNMLLYPAFGNDWRRLLRARTPSLRNAGRFDHGHLPVGDGLHPRPPIMDGCNFWFSWCS